MDSLIHKQEIKILKEGLFMWQNAAVGLEKQLTILKIQRETLRDTLREVRLLVLAGEFTDTLHAINQVLADVPMGEYILREECEAKVKAAQDAASAYVAQQFTSTKIDA